MFPLKKKKIYGNCPSCKGDHLIYRSRNLTHAYFSCSKCGYTQMVFDPWEPAVNLDDTANTIKLAQMHNSANRMEKSSGNIKTDVQETTIEQFNHLKQILDEISKNQSLINEKMDTVLSIVEKLHEAGILSDSDLAETKQLTEMQAGPDNEEYFSTGKAAEILGYTTKNAYQKVLNLIHKGKITAKKPGRSYIVAKTELERFLMENI